MNELPSQTLDSMHAIVPIDSIVSKVTNRLMLNHAFHVAMSMNLNVDHHISGSGALPLRGIPNIDLHMNIKFAGKLFRDICGR